MLSSLAFSSTEKAALRRRVPGWTSALLLVAVLGAAPLDAEVRVFIEPADSEQAVALLRGLGAEIVYENRELGDLLVRIDESVFGTLRISPAISRFLPDYQNCIQFLDGCDDELVTTSIIVEPTAVEAFRAYVQEIGGEYDGANIYLIPPHGLREVEDRPEVLAMELEWRQTVGGLDGLLLGEGHRFRAWALWRTVAQETPVYAIPRELAQDTGAFRFFDAGNLEVVVKVLPACEINGHIWVFVSGLTDLEVELTVRDALRTYLPESPPGIGTVTYTNPLGRPFEPILDTTALPCP
jgi:hypothetical protein